MSEFLEMSMLICFGASWPLNLIHSFHARSAKGKSPAFLCLILLGYVVGMAAKLCNAAYMADFSEKWYVLAFYLLNFLMVLADLILYFRNRTLDKKGSVAATV